MVTRDELNRTQGLCLAWIDPIARAKTGTCSRRSLRSLKRVGLKKRLKRSVIKDVSENNKRFYDALVALIHHLRDADMAGIASLGMARVKELGNFPDPCEQYAEPPGRDKRVFKLRFRCRAYHIFSIGRNFWSPLQSSQPEYAIISPPHGVARYERSSPFLISP